jgi:Helicase conserved C-terminal domain
MEQRSVIVQKFNDNDEFRVLIFSKVGSTGLNLTRANFVVLLVRFPSAFFFLYLRLCNQSTGPALVSSRRTSNHWKGVETETDSSRASYPSPGSRDG